MPSSSERVGRKQVLVIDDDVHFVRAIEWSLQAEHTVSCMSAALPALLMIEAGAWFDVILCDLMMPDMSGMDLYATLGPILEKPCSVNQLRALVKDVEHGAPLVQTPTPHTPRHGEWLWNFLAVGSTLYWRQSCVEED